MHVQLLAPYGEDDTFLEVYLKPRSQAKSSKNGAESCQLGLHGVEEESNIVGVEGSPQLRQPTLELGDDPCVHCNIEKLLEGLHGEDE